MALPELIVFDLDFTLWDCGGTYCDCLTPPFLAPGGAVQDRSGRIVELYSDVWAILDYCDSKGIAMALASRTEEPVWARQLLDLLAVTDRFGLAEIYPSSKLQHFAALQESSGIDFQAMLFFDDEQRNIVEVETLGVTSIYVPSGMTQDVFDDGLARFAGRQ